ncbi:MAG: HD domain-containing protein [Syntrophales bacterium]|jgi:dGTPase|nr:HD domain-containing protein [Syntrophales bacterium]
MPFENPLKEEQYKERLHARDEDVRGDYFRDQTAIIHSMPYRRLKHKTQVYFSPNNDHICTRIEHSLHVATIAATISKGLGLNADMAYAIGLGHDLGHAPFGHAGETALNSKCKDIGGFIHEIHGLRVADVLGSRGVGLNLTYGVRDGIICHCGEAPDQKIQPRSEVLDLINIKKRDKLPSSWEGCITRMADRIAYLGRDLEDSIDGGFLEKKEIPEIIQNELGESNGEIIDNLVVDVITNSKKEEQIAFSDSKYKVLLELYKFSVARIYSNEKITRYGKYCERIITEIFDYLLNLYDKWDSNIQSYYNSPCPLDVRFGWYLEKMEKIYDEERAGATIIVRDYVAGMTDLYALKCMKEISLPEELSFDRKLSMSNKANTADAKTRG